MVSTVRAGQTLWVLGFSSALLACGATKLPGLGSEPDVMAPAPQGAGVFTLRAPSAAIRGMCPVESLTSAIPAVSGPGMLDADTYVEHIVDGEDAAAVGCRVEGSSSFSFEGSLGLGPVELRIANGMLGVDKTGIADVVLVDPRNFQGSLMSTASCSIDAATSPGQNFQVKPGSMWASFDCPSVEQAPDVSCAASGIFVLENCER